MRVVSPPRSRIVLAIVAAFVVVATILIALNWTEVRHVLAQASWPVTAVAVAFCLASDACLSYSYVLVNRAFSIDAPFAYLMEIGFVSSALNNVVALFGAPAHSMRLMLVRQRGVESEQVIAASLFHSFLSNVVMLALFIIGLISLLVGHVVLGSSPGTVILGVAMILALFLLVTALVVIRPLRRGVLNIVKVVWQFLSHRDISVFVANLDEALVGGLDAFRVRRTLLIGLVVVLAFDWAFSTGGLWFCFAALGTGPPLSVLLAGFSIGISAGNLSMLPGGLGVQEASMAGVFGLLHVPLAQAALAALLFRVANNFIPFFVSLPFYAHLMAGRRERAGRPPAR